MPGETRACPMHCDPIVRRGADSAGWASSKGTRRPEPAEARRKVRRRWLFAASRKHVSAASGIGVTLAEIAEIPGDASERIAQASAAPRRPAARAGAHATEHAAVLHAAEMDADISAGGLAGQFELVGFQASDLVADARGLLEFEVGGGVAHALLELGDVAAQIVADQMDVARHAGIDRVVVALGGRLQDLADVLLDRGGGEAARLVVRRLPRAAPPGLGHRALAPIGPLVAIEEAPA